MFLFLPLSLREDSGIVAEVRRLVLAMADHHQMTFVVISEVGEEIMEVEEEVSCYWSIGWFYRYQEVSLGSFQACFSSDRLSL